ncbi:MAG: hypothetical protein AAF570_29150, partial [Bacteroidota bacterium]
RATKESIVESVEQEIMADQWGDLYHESDDTGAKARVAQFKQNLSGLVEGPLQVLKANKEEES